MSRWHALVSAAAAAAASTAARARATAPLSLTPSPPVKFVQDPASARAPFRHTPLSRPLQCVGSTRPRTVHAYRTGAAVDNFSTARRAVSSATSSRASWSSSPATSTFSSSSSSPHSSSSPSSPSSSPSPSSSSSPTPSSPVAPASTRQQSSQLQQPGNNSAEAGSAPSSESLDARRTHDNVVDAVVERSSFGAEPLSLVGGNEGEARRRSEQYRIAQAIARLVEHELPPHCRLNAHDVAWVSDELCFVGVGSLTNYAGFRYAMSRDVFRARRVAAVRDIFDRNVERRGSLDRVFRVVSDDVTAMIEDVQKPPHARLVNEYVAPGSVSAVPEFAAGDAASPRAASSLNAMEGDGGGGVSGMPVPSMGEFSLGRHDIDFVEYLHDIGLRIVPVESEHDMHALSADRLPVQQSTNHLLMVAPTAFEPNVLAAQDNYFMHVNQSADGGNGGGDSNEMIARNVLDEYAQLFHNVVDKVGARVHLFTHDRYHDAPDSVFPNNWFSTHTDLEVGECTLVLYPMKSPNRRKERRPEFVSRLHSFRRYTNVYDLTRQESSKSPRYLEGTGSLVLDRINRVAYLARSDRSDPSLAKTWARVMDYELVTFDSTDDANRPIYHTNVMMCVGTSVAVCCAESISDRRERERVLDKLRSTGHEVVEISSGQMNKFCGNVLEIESRYGRPVMAMSTGALNAFTPEQRDCLRERLDEIVHADIDTIEQNGGGGVRCSIGELF